MKIDQAKKPTMIANKNGIETLNQFFNKNNLQTLIQNTINNSIYLQIFRNHLTRKVYHKYNMFYNPSYIY